MFSLNERAAQIVRRMVADADPLGLAVASGPGGATVVDAGVDAVGSLEAGRLFAEVCMGGLGKVRFCDLQFDQLWLPGLIVTVSLPPLAYATQLAGWVLEAGDESEPYRAMGSGPARSLYGAESIFEQFGYQETADVAVLCLESPRLPPDELVAEVAERCRVSAERLSLTVAPAASVVGSVQVAARVVETGLHKMAGLGFDVGAVLSALGTCPLAPVAGDELRAMGRADDAVLYGGRAWYTVRAEDAQIERLIDRLPSSASRDYGDSFYDILQRYDGDFYRIDPLLFSTAEIVINSAVSGRTFRAGRVDGERLRRMLLG
jgi:methenyltetrahydromethanopterin cyclohydrolase